MKALIASGGRGTRLRPITHTRNKHLIPIANKPILHYAIEAAAEAGHSRDRDRRERRQRRSPRSDRRRLALGRGDHATFPRSRPGGLAQVVALAEQFIGKERFIFYLGDNMVVGGVERFIDEFEKSNCNCFLTLAKVKDPERFGVPEIRDGRIVSIEEKPKAPKSSYAVAGIYLYDSSIFEAVRDIGPARGASWRSPTRTST